MSNFDTEKKMTLKPSFLVRDGRIGHNSFASQKVATPARFFVRQNMAPPFDSPRRQSSLPAHPARSLCSLCGMGESNSHPQFGKLLFYH